MTQEISKRVITFDNIDWIVLDERGGKLLLLAKDIAERHPYSADRFCAAWEDSALHEHLGDGQFLLSVEEAGRYFADGAERTACFQGAPHAWWLRDIGIRNHAAFVGKDGSISTHGYRVDCAWCGVRPAMWVESRIS
jgi:hypothetical protein